MEKGRRRARWPGWRGMAYPGLLVGGLSLALALVGPFGELVAVVVATFGVSSCLLVLQRLGPFHEDWGGRPKDFGIDLAHLVATGLAGELGRALVFGLAVKGSIVLAGVFGFGLWPAWAPSPVQWGLGLLLGDLGAYAAHRACHRSALLWRIHAMHHSSERLYVFAASRSHPLNFVLAWSATAVPLLVLGAPEHVLFVVGAFTALNGMLQHANVDFHHGMLNHVFSTADLHRWHHSTDFDESNTNFGSNLAVWDKVFGTWFLPEERRSPERVGVEGLAMPESVWAHLASPVLLDRWELTDLSELDDFTLESEPEVASTPEVSASP